MATKLDPTKLLPSAKGTSPNQGDDENKISGYIIRSSVRQINLKSESLVISQRDEKESDSDLTIIHKNLIKIDKLLKSDFKIGKKKTEVAARDKEKEQFSKEEKQFETPKVKGVNLPKLPSGPKLGFFDRIKNFLFFTALGWLFPKLLKFLPKLDGFVKTINSISKFAGKLFEKLHDGFDNLLKFGADLKDKTLGFISDITGGDAKDFEKKFSGLQKLFDQYVDVSIVAGLLGLDLGMAGFDEYRKWKGKNEGARTPGSVAEGEARSGSRAASSAAEAETRAGRTATNVAREAATDAAGAAAKKPGWFSKLVGPLAGLKAPLGKFLGALAPGVGAAFSFMDAENRFSNGDNVGGWISRISGILQAFASISAVAGIIAGITGIGLPVTAVLEVVAGFAETAAIVLDVIQLIRDVLHMFPLLKNIPIIGPIISYSTGGRVVGKYATGGVKTAAGNTQRTLKIQSKTRPLKIKPPKSQPGKDVGGEKRIKKLYPDTSPGKKLSMDEWIDSNMAGTYQDYENWYSRNDKKANPYKAITGTAKILKDIPIVGGIMGASVDIAMGQKPSKIVYHNFANSIAALSDNLADQKASQSISALTSQMRGFAEGGTVPSSRQLKNNLNNQTTILAKVIENSVTQKVNEAIKNLEKELQFRGPGEPERPPGEDGAGDGPEVKSINLSGISPEDVDALGRMIQAESGGESSLGKAAVMNVILNRYRLARSGRAYIPPGRTKDNVTITDILFAANQFSPIKDGSFRRTTPAAGRSALAVAISSGGNDPELLKRKLMQSGLSERDALYVIVSTAFSNPEDRTSRPFNTREVAVGRHAFQESSTPSARLSAPGSRIESRVEYDQTSSNQKARSLAEAAKLMKGFSTAAGPEGGNKACVWAVNRVFEKAGMTPPWGNDDNVDHAETAMVRAGYSRIRRGQQQPGDLYVVHDQEHIGIVLPNGNIISNSSSGARFSWEAPLSAYENSYGGEGKFYRIPGPPVRSQRSPGVNVPQSDSDRIRILNDLNSKGLQTITLDGKEYYYRSEVNAGRPELRVYQNNILGAPFNSIDITNENKWLEDAIWKQILKNQRSRPTEVSSVDLNENNLMASNMSNQTTVSPDTISRYAEDLASTASAAAQFGGLLSKSNPRVPIPNSFASYDSPESRSSVVFVPIMIPMPVFSGQNSGVAFPVPVPVGGGSIDIGKALNSSRGY